MLVAIIVAFFLGGPNASGAILTQDMLKSFERLAQQAITEPARAEVVMQEVAALRDELKQFDKTFAKSGKVLTELYKDHDAGPADLQAELDLLNDEWEAAQSLALDRRFVIRDHMTEDEWAAAVAQTTE
ncbi:hypothetical protein KEHDKFFH_02675 [Marinobacter maroccanus]|uniref:Uncharacterized protein n=1 Tax=Marinobacter maroccanus TaxID=2055143 RepID=A0A2S5ZDE1_9GAMM|nr:hypothetical protein [Marinobacter maroccanus]PPI85361.1 hypothetical protein KEHDKFFH_02675 [Marinobacter maroccanus]